MHVLRLSCCILMEAICPVDSASTKFMMYCSKFPTFQSCMKHLKEEAKWSIMFCLEIIPDVLGPQRRDSGVNCLFLFLGSGMLQVSAMGHSK